MFKMPERCLLVVIFNHCTISLNSQIPKFQYQNQPIAIYAIVELTRYGKFVLWFPAGAINNDNCDNLKDFSKKKKTGQNGLV